jgi:hypothetical protein
VRDILEHKFIISRVFEAYDPFFATNEAFIEVSQLYFSRVIKKSPFYILKSTKQWVGQA